MSPRRNCLVPTIKCVLDEFAEDRDATLKAGEHRAYRRVLFFLELCINNYGHRNLDVSERAFCEKNYHARGGAQRHFFEMFGPEKLLPELDFFANVYLKKNVFTSERIEAKAPQVVDDLKGWLLERDYVSCRQLEASHEVSSRRTKLRVRARRVARLLEERSVSVDPTFFDERDYIDTDDHPVSRVDPGRFWLRVYRSAEPEEIGPVSAPEAATKSLRVGWNLCCALARVQGRWRIVAVDEVYPN